MHKNFWYPIYDESTLAPGSAVEVRLFDIPIALYRDREGHCYALEDACAHRSSKLSTGKVVGSNLRCPYHGWQYDSKGQCVDIPTFKPGEKVPSHIRVTSFPVMSYCGLIWLWPGDPDKKTTAPEMAEPENHYASDSSWQVIHYERDLNFRHSLLIENLLDPAHIHFVHEGTMSNPRNAGPISPQLDVDDQGVRPSGPRRGVQSAFFGPVCVELTFNWGGNFSQIQYFYCLPVSSTTMRLISRIYTPGSHRNEDSVIAGINHVLNEDIAVLENVEQRLRDGYPQVNYAVKADLAITEYQRWCDRFAE